jgi:hypothetical protein
LDLIYFIVACYGNIQLKPIYFMSISVCSSSLMCE